MIIYVFQFTQEKKENNLMLMMVISIKLWILRHPELTAHRKVKLCSCT